jgi:diguanylate cyclase (GGDEF)-like protein
MVLDQTSLLMALGFAGLALSLTLFIAWLSSRSDGFLLTWSSGMAVLVVGVVAFSVYSFTENYLLGLISLDCLVVGFAIVYGASHQFRTGESPLRHAGIAALIGATVVTIPFLFGLDGLGSLWANIFSAAFLFATAHKFWQARAEAPASITGMVVLYCATALSFVLCAAVILVKNPLVAGAPPSGWAEDLNSITCLFGITGIGALSLALNQARVARRHQNDARTDQLTGLVNRRELFDLYDAGNLNANTAVIVFDLDRFKTINDLYGHATGDAVLRRFALAMNENLRPRDTAARLGGEEFCLVMPRCTPDLAVLVAERIRALFCSDTVMTEKGPLQSTVSAGVAFTADGDISFDALLREADKALYLAKGGGRNRVMSPGLRLVA